MVQRPRQPGREVAQGLGLSQDAVDTVIVPVDIVVADLSTVGPVDDLEVARGLAAFMSVVILFILVMAFGQFVGSAVVEEKQSRVAELVLAKVSTASMLVGKVLGVGGLGLVQLIVLGLTYMLGLWAFGADSRGLDLFRLGLGSLAWMALWFVIGFVMYSFVFATMGATVSRREDLQSLTYVPSVLLLPAYAIAAASLAGAPAPLLAPMSMIPIWSRCSCRSGSSPATRRGGRCWSRCSARRPSSPCSCGSGPACTAGQRCGWGAGSASARRTGQADAPTVARCDVRGPASGGCVREDRGASPPRC